MEQLFIIILSKYIKIFKRKISKEGILIIIVDQKREY